MPDCFTNGRKIQLNPKGMVYLYDKCQKKETMKAIRLTMLAFLVIAFTACNMDNADNPSNSAPSSDTTTHVEPDMTTGEPVTYQLDTMQLDTTGDAAR